MHFDVRVDDVEARPRSWKRSALGRMHVGQPSDANFIPMADPEGNEFCVGPGVPLISKGETSSVHMVREVYQAKRGKAPEVVAAFKTIDPRCERAGYTNRRIYVDYDGPLDTVVHQYELESLDRYFAVARQAMADPDRNTRAFTDAFNDNTTAGRREIYAAELERALLRARTESR